MECFQWKVPMVKSNLEMKTDIETFIADLADFKKYVLEVFASWIETNQSNDLRDCIT